MQNKTVTLGDIAAAIGQPAPANASMVIRGINTLIEAADGELSFLASDQYLKHLTSTRASCVLVGRKVAIPAANSVPVLRVDDVDLALASVLPLFACPVPRPVGIDPSARIDPSATLPADAAVGPCAVIGRNVRIGARCAIHAGVVISDDVTIGDDCVLFPNVVIREHIRVGHRVVIHAGSVLGTDGFGYRWNGKEHVKIPQIGTVVIEDDVELGSCVCIDRAKVGATVIGRGTKIDNLVQIAHNVRTGAHCIMAGQTGIAGSTTLGNGVVLGGASSLRDHITVGDGAMVAARSAVHEDIPAKAIVSGMPALPHRQSLREQAAFRKLPELMVQIRKVQEQIETFLQSQSDGATEGDVLGT